MRSSSHIVTSAVGGLLGVLVACTSPDPDEAGSAVRGDHAGTESAGVAEPDGGPDDAGDPERDAAVVVGAGNDRCNAATPIPLSASNPRVELEATTLGAAHDVDAPCAGGGAAAGGDVFYAFAVSKRVIVYADTFGADWDTVLFLLSADCAPLSAPTTQGDAVCNAGACGTSQSRVVALLEPGAYRLGLSGRDGAAGQATIHFEWALAGSGTVAPLPKGKSVLTGQTVGTSGSIEARSPDCLAAGPENSYWWARCPADPGGPLRASTCDGTTWESIVSLQLAKTPPYVCNIDGCGLQADLNFPIPEGAGLAVLSIDGQTGKDVGAYTMNVTRP